MNTLAERLHFLRDRVSPRPKFREIAEYCKVNPVTVSQWFSGDIKSLSGQTLLPLARFFRVNPKWLNEGIGLRDAEPEASVEAQERAPQQYTPHPWPFRRVEPDEWESLEAWQKAKVEALATEFLLMGTGKDPAPATGTLGR